MPPNIILEFIQALNEEIETIKKGGGGSIVKVFNGRFLREIAGTYVYIFNLENFLAILDESPAEIEISGKRYPAHVLLTQGLEVEIGIEHNFGPFIPEAKLQTNLWYLLELLKKKYEECQSGSLKPNFSLSEVIFTGDEAVFHSCKTQINYSPSAHPPNPSQKKAIESSFFSPLVIIWGPPGTGKTKTIAKAVESHLNAGRRVLLVSHANNAVDEALEGVASQATSFYEDGKLIRLGKPQEKHLKRLEKDFPLVLLDKIAEKIGETLTKEKNSLESEKTKIESFLDMSEELLNAVLSFKNLSSEVKSLMSAISETKKKLHDIDDELKHIEDKLKIDKERYLEAKSSGTIARFFKRLNPHKIQREIDESGLVIDYKKRMANEISARLPKIKNVMKEKELELKRAKGEVDFLLRDYNLISMNNIVECPVCKTYNRIKKHSNSVIILCGKCKADITNYPIVDYSLEKIEAKKKNLGKRKDEIFGRISEINRQLEEIQKKAISEAKLVATTLTKTFSAKQFPDVPFDVLVLDEASGLFHN